MKYSVAHFQTTFAEQWQADIFAQALCDIGFDTIDGSDAYIPTTQLDLPALQALVAHTEGVSLLSVEDCPDENWNAVWESEHPAEQLPMGVVIVPHCAFGAGHHETTGMLIDALMERDWTGCRVLDNGCGTGVLGIFAAKRGAEHVLAIDIDDKSVENTRENAARNGVEIEAKQATLEALADDTPSAGSLDLILSNIHRNILLSQLPLYARLTKEVWLSGFYEDDAPALIAAAEKVGFRVAKQSTRNNWCMLCLHS